MLTCFDLTGQIAVVTGAGKGLGREFALALGQSGATLHLIGRTAEALECVAAELERQGNACTWTAADITDEAAVDRAVAECLAHHGQIDILVNNAGTGRINVSPQESTLRQWTDVWGVNVTGSVICALAVGREMVKRGRGKIINLSSISGFVINKGVHGGSYDVTKQAVVGLTRALAAEWAPHNVNVNAIAPGYFETDPNREFFEQSPEFRDQVLNLIPAGRIGQPSELGGTVVFLASAASDYLHGSVVVVDGGYTIW